MPITDSTYTGTWTLRDLLAVGVSREQIASKLKNPDGTPEVTTSYMASGQLVGGGAPVEARAVIPRRVYRRVRKLLAPYLIDEAVDAFRGTKKSPEVGDPDPKDHD